MTSPLLARSAKGRGGWRQRRDQIDRERSRSPTFERANDQHLLNAWLQDWAWGFLSGAKLGYYCSQGVRDNLSHTMLRRFAATASGASPQNVQRQILTLYGVEDAGELVETIADSSVNSFVYPHDVIALMSRRFPEQFRTHLGADPGRLRAFWASFGESEAGRSFMQNHPHLRSRDDLDHVIPLFIHADGFPVSKKQSAVELQWGSLTGRGTDRQVLFTSSVWVHDESPLPTLAWHYFGYDLETLAVGLFPEGSPSCPKFPAESRRGKLAGSPFAPSSEGKCFKAVFVCFNWRLGHVRQRSWLG